MADHDNMLAGASDASSSSHDRYTTTPEEESPPPPGQPGQPQPTQWILNDAIPDGFMRCFGPSATDNTIAEIRLRNVVRVKIMSTTLSHPRTANQTFLGELWAKEERLHFIAMPTDDLAHVSGQVNNMFAVELSRKVMKNEMRALTFHVLDFDFTFIKDQILSRFTDANREHYNAQLVEVWITISPGFARMWTPTKLEEWINWRDAEHAAGRGLFIRYRVSGSFTLNAAELEEIRYFLHYIDPYGDSNGDMGSPMVCFKRYFMAEYQRLGI
jgi:hypothetical protein